MKDDLAASAEWDASAAWAPIRTGESSFAARIYAEQQARCPVSFAPLAGEAGIWHAFRASDVAAILGDPATFSSAVAKFGAPLIPIELDPPRHTIYRAVLGKMMSPRRMVGYQEAIRQWVIDELEPLIASGGGDLEPFLYRLPMRTFCLLMGEEDEGFDLLDKARRSGSPSPQRMDEAAAREREALMEPLREFCRKRLRARRGKPGEDLASDIANAAIEGKLIDEDEAVSMLTLVYVAGHGTTTSGMQSALICIGRHPHAQQALRANRTKIPAAIEESLRLETPLHTLPRYCTAATELGGRDVQAGDQVYPVFGAANVDAALFPNPEIFDIERKPAHFSFGRGIHACAGAPLARTQIRVLLEELLARTENFSVVEPLERMPWPNNRCLSLPMKLEARR
jgi:cytochrome P450